MYKYVIKRLLALIPVILGVIFIIYLILYLTPGDAVTTILGVNYTEEAAERVREELGLNQPFLVQFGTYVLNLCRLDFGNSYITGLPVIEQIAARFPATFILVFVSMALCTILSLPVGVQSAVKPNSFFSNFTSALSMIGIALPTFWLGLMLIIIFSLTLGWLPSGGKSGFSSLILPALTVGLGLAALITRTTRSSMLDVIRQDYMTTARAKGCSEKRVIFTHGLKNALIPIITAIGLQMSMVITGSVLAETVFSWPGIGRLVYDSIAKRDTPMVTGSIILCSVFMCLINLFVDLVYAFFDPRIKAQYSKKR